ncbi:MAG: hypothetical protein ABII88_06145 [Candidatus Omnitrophota bacterium]
MQYFDLGIAWNWEPDKHFIEKITAECKRQGVSHYFVGAFNLEETIEKIKSRKLMFRMFLDRASDTDSVLLGLACLLKERGCKIINDMDKTARAIDKGIMHVELLSKGINVPHTIIVSDFEHGLKNLHEEISRLGSPFIIKLAHGGGGVGVMLDARAFEDLLRARHEFGEGKYLLQERIHPAFLNGKRAWFRVYYAFGKIIPCWWDDITKIFDVMTKNGMHFLGLGALHEITLKIARICGLEFFSTEIALTEERKFVSVDYVNDQCDMRLKSTCYDGVPDVVVDEIIRLLIRYVVKNARKKEKTVCC